MEGVAVLPLVLPLTVSPGVPPVTTPVPAPLPPTVPTVSHSKKRPGDKLSSDKNKVITIDISMSGCGIIYYTDIMLCNTDIICYNNI